eukprot:TRINITY_DN2679_c0_g1_i4.p1 TRINITY_DN2679_c0_g1~~TRINITY_DN2679_c0_g1_i4.p1  ORF type:complete len:814 (+),score=157.58 TRINITY_DN2679_c0_g1_i4:260-2701(+)
MNRDPSVVSVSSQKGNDTGSLQPGGSSFRQKSFSSRSTLRSGASRSRMSQKSMRGTRKNLEQQEDKNKVPQVQVLLDGQDVTPVSLLGGKGGPGGKPGRDGAFSPSQSGFESQFNSFLDLSQSSQFKSYGGLSQSSRGTTSPTHYDSDADSVLSAHFDDSQARSQVSEGDDHHHQKRSKEPERIAVEIEDEFDTELNERELDRIIHISLKETPTFWMLDLPAVCVARDSPQVQAVTERNAAYRELKKNRVGNDSYVERAMQTFNNAEKSKDVQVSPAPVTESGSMVTQWDIHDTFEEMERKRLKALRDASADNEQLPGEKAHQEDGDKDDEDEEIADDLEQAAAAVQNAGTDPDTSHLNAEASVAESHGGFSDAASSRQVVPSSAQKQVNLESLRGLSDTLRIVEHMIAQNSYHERHLQYRHFSSRFQNDRRRKAAAEIASAGGDTTIADSIFKETRDPDLQLLWSFSCDLTAEKNVSCMGWNYNNPDILAVGYGAYDFTKQSPGLLLCWSLKNPEFPDRVIPTPCGVTSVDFSRHHPYLLAAGYYDGSVAIFDIRKEQDTKPILISGHTSGKHSEPVWAVRWVDRGAERGEFLISMSTDGRVTQWSLKKGMEYTDLMRLKRIGNQSKAGDAKNEAFISRSASGMCFDFSVADPNIYLAGTEDGNIHKCSCSYNEQYLDNFIGHTGPVYKIRCSPFDPNVFLSCSADWTARLWHMEQESPKITFEPCTEHISDISWSPTNSTVFASVTGDGRLDVWDLSVSTYVWCPSSLLPPYTSPSPLARLLPCFLWRDFSAYSCIYESRPLRCVLTCRAR